MPAIGDYDDHDNVYTLEDYRKSPEFIRRVRELRPEYSPRVIDHMPHPQQPPEDSGLVVAILVGIAKFMCMGAISGTIALLAIGLTKHY